MIRLIAATDSKRGIAVASGVPWRLPGDVAYFHEQTELGLIVMGWATYSEFAAPLHDRVNYVLTRSDAPLRPGFEGTHTFDALLADHRGDDVWVIGGAAVFAATIAQADELFVTQVEGDFDCIKFFPPYTEEFVMYDRGKPHQDGDVRYRFERWRRGVAPASVDPSRVRSRPSSPSRSTSSSAPPSPSAPVEAGRTSPRSATA